MESLKETCGPKHSIDNWVSDCLQLEIKREIIEISQNSVNVKIKEEHLERNISAPSFGTGHGTCHNDNTLETTLIEVKCESEKTKSNFCLDEKYEKNRSNSFNSIRERLRKLRSKIPSKVPDKTDKSIKDNIATSDAQTDSSRSSNVKLKLSEAPQENELLYNDCNGPCLSPLLQIRNICTNTVKDECRGHEEVENHIMNDISIKEESWSSYEEDEQNLDNVLIALKNTNINSDVIIKKEMLNECLLDQKSVKNEMTITENDCEYSSEHLSNYNYSDNIEDTKSLHLFPSDGSDVDSIYNVINTADANLPSPFQIVNVVSLAEAEKPLVTLSPICPSEFSRNVNRPKRKTATKNKSVDANIATIANNRRRQRQRVIKKKMHSPEKLNKRKPYRKKVKNINCTEFPKPMKEEDPSVSSAENDIVTILPRPIIFKNEMHTDTQAKLRSKRFQTQPKVCIKRLSLRDILKATNTMKGANNPATTTETESVNSGSCLDSGISTASSRHPRENHNVLLEIAAERAFINHHLNTFGYSPVQFDLYNELNDLQIFLKYLFGGGTNTLR